MSDAIPETATAADVVDPRAKRKQAVVLVHGMGEQVPMGTLRGFVEQMWVRDSDLHAIDAQDQSQDGNPVWWKPDSRAGSLELSRITTRDSHERGAKASAGPRTDFYEFYWADLTAANTLEQLKDWFMSLLVRAPYQVPRDVTSMWVILWLSTLGVGGLFAWKGLATIGFLTAPGWVTTATVVLGLVYTLVIGFVLNTFGDVARYVRAEPPNIAARREIRQRGMALLNAITASGQYDRILLVGHSLGSIIAYDLLKFLWSTNEAARTMRDGDPLHQSFLDCAAAGAALTSPPTSVALDRYRDCQRAVFNDMQKAGAQDAWLISDFVTIGSPLTHAQFLMERDLAAFEKGVEERRFPTSPAVLDERSLLYRPKGAADPTLWQAHHATPFAAIPWTNIYDPSRFVLFGDMIGGPVSELFGPGIRDVAVRIEDVFGLLPERLFTHTKYWSDVNATNPHLTALRQALDLAR